MHRRVAHIDAFPPLAIAALGGVSVVIPTSRGRKRLEPVMAYLLRDSAVQEIVVVDDVPDATAMYARAKSGQVTVLKTPGVGPDRARQCGLEAASGCVVLLLDDDVRPRAGLAAGHAARHVTPGLVVVGHMPVEESLSASSEPVPVALYRREYSRRVSDYERDPTTILRYLWGGNVSMRRDDALRVGLVSPTFRGRRHEDRDLGLRCLAAGMTGVFDRSLAASHEYVRSEAEFLDDARAQGAERVLLHYAHPDLLGPVDSRAFSSDLPALLRLVVAAGRHPTAERVVSAGLRLGLRAAVTSHLRASEVAVLKLARRVALTAGARGAEHNIAKSHVTR